MARIATQVILGAKIKDLGLKHRVYKHFGVKESVFPFNMFPEVDPLLGPEMRSTGEVLGLANSYGLAFYKSQTAAGYQLPLKGRVLVTVAGKDKTAVLPAVNLLAKVGFEIVATNGTAEFLKQNGIESEPIKKLHEGRPHIVDALHNREVNLVINTPSGKESIYEDSYIRKAAIKYKVPYVTTPAAALACAQGIEAALKLGPSVKALQDYHKEIS